MTADPDLILPLSVLRVTPTAWMPGSLARRDSMVCTHELQVIPRMVTWEGPGLRRIYRDPLTVNPVAPVLYQ